MNSYTYLILTIYFFERTSVQGFFYYEFIIVCSEIAVKQKKFGQTLFITFYAVSGIFNATHSF